MWPTLTTTSTLRPDLQRLLNGQTPYWANLMTAEPGWSHAPARSSESTDDFVDALSWVLSLIPPSPRSSPPQAGPLSTNKDKTMNEILTALEAMIRRVVAEEVAKLALPSTDMDSELFETRFLVMAAQSQSFDEAVKHACVDQPWLHDEIVDTVLNDGAISTYIGETTNEDGNFKEKVETIVENMCFTASAS